jgi:hypothetical protein
MVSCAFPSVRSRWLLKYALDFIEPKVEAEGKDEVAKEIERMRLERQAQERFDDKYWKSEGTYCAELCAEILGLSNPSERTAADVVELCKREMGAVEVAQPILYSEIKTKDDANIIRPSHILVHGMAAGAEGAEETEGWINYDDYV